MAKQIIIDWQRDSILVASCKGSGASVTVESLSEQRIGPSPNDAEGTIPLNGDAAQGLNRAIEELGLRKSDVTVVASREMVEVRTISVPRMDTTDLPDVIRFQSQRQLANMGDNWALDYVMLPEEPGQEMLTALVGAIAPTVLHEMEAACAQAGVQLTHVALRPLEIARFATASGKVSVGDASMVICLSAHDVDLLILNRGSVVQIRGTKLPSEASLQKQALNGELRRSLLAASSQLASKQLSSALLVAAPDLAAVMQTQIAEVLGCQVKVVDPTELLASSLPGRTQLAHTSANRLAGLAGVMNFAAADQKSRIDFKDPKKRPPPKSKTTTYLLAGAATAMLALGGIYWWTSTNRALDEDLAMLKDQIASQQGLQKSSQERIAELEEVKKFLDASPNWLDELTYIAEKIPSAEKVMFENPVFSVEADGTGVIKMPVGANSYETIEDFEASLRDESHVVAGKNSRQLPVALKGLYRWTVDETISLKGRGWNLIEQLETASGAKKNVTSKATPDEVKQNPSKTPDAKNEVKPEPSEASPAKSGVKT